MLIFAVYEREDPETILTILIYKWKPVRNIFEETFCNNNFCFRLMFNKMFHQPFELHQSNFKIFKYFFKKVLFRTFAVHLQIFLVF